MSPWTSSAAWSDRLSSCGHTQGKVLSVKNSADWNIPVPLYVDLMGCSCNWSHLKIQGFLQIWAEMLTLKVLPALPREPPGSIPSSPHSPCVLACMEKVLVESLCPGFEFQSYHLSWLDFGFSICKVGVWSQVNSKGSLIHINISRNETQLKTHWQTQDDHMYPKITSKLFSFLFF